MILINTSEYKLIFIFSNDTITIIKDLPMNISFENNSTYMINLVLEGNTYFYFLYLYFYFSL